MARIINNTDVTLSPASQQAISNGAAHAGLDNVYIYPFPKQEDAYNTFNIFADEDATQYVGTIDTDTNDIFETQIPFQRLPNHFA